MNLVTFDDKVFLNENSDIPDINKIKDDDINQIKNAINNLIYPVGSYYETSDTSFNPNVTWGGTWVLEQDGTALVSKSTTTGSIFNNTVGTTVGEEKHTLTVNEMPSHNHKPLSGYGMVFQDGIVKDATTAGYAGGIRWNGTYTGGASTSSTGGGEAHNIVQPSKIVNRWHRTA